MLRLLSRQYVLAARIIARCHKDSALTNEEIWILSQLPTDCHPDALACRLRLTLLCRDCGTDPAWEAEEDFKAYLSVHTHVSVACRLSESEEQRLLSYYPIDSRAQFLHALANAPTQITVHSTCQSGGRTLDTVHGELMPAALEQICRSPSSCLGRMNMCYDRPEEQLIAGAPALRLVDTLWNRGGLLSWGCRTGFALLYDILLGRRQIGFVTDEAEHLRALEGKGAPTTRQKNKSQAPGSDKEQARLRKARHKRIRQFLTANAIKIPPSAPKTTQTRNQTETLPWENQLTVRVPPSLKEAMAVADGGSRRVTKQAASFVKLMTSAILLKNSREVSKINLTDPSGVVANILLSLANAVLHDLPVASLMEEASAKATELIHKASREHRKWEFSVDSQPWIAFNKFNGDMLDRCMQRGDSHAYLRIDADVLTGPLRSSVIHKNTGRWYWIDKYLESSNKYLMRTYGSREAEEVSASDLSVSVSVRIPGPGQEISAYVGATKQSMRVRPSFVITCCGTETLTLEKLLDSANEEHQQLDGLDAVPDTDTQRAHATIMTLKGITTAFAKWKSTAPAKPLISILSRKTDPELALYIACAAYTAHLPKHTATGTWPHASKTACSDAVSEWTQSLLALQQPCEGESSADAQKRFEAEITARFEKPPNIKIVPMLVAVAVREAGADTHETNLLVSPSDSFVSVRRRLLRALAKKHSKLTERIKAGRCTFSVDDANNADAPTYDASDDITLLSSIADESEPPHDSTPSLRLIATVQPPREQAEQVVDFSCLPSFPFLRNETALFARGVSCGTDVFRTFFSSLAATSLAICTREQANGQREPFKGLVCDPDVVDIPAKTSLNSAPTLSDCACPSKKLRGVAAVDRVRWSGVSPDDVRAFSASPLQNFGLLRREDVADASSDTTTEHVSLQPAVADVDALLAQMPLDLTRCPDAQSVVAQDLLKRINHDLRQSATALGNKQVPRLTCLDGSYAYIHFCVPQNQFQSPRTHFIHYS